MAVASVSTSNIVLWLFQHASMRWSRHQWELDCDGRSLRWWVITTVNTHSRSTYFYSKFVYFIFQFVNITNTNSCWRIRFLAYPRTVALHWTSRFKEDCPSKIQFFYIRIWFGAGEVGCTVRICTAYRTNLLARHRWSPNWSKCNR